MKTSLKYVLCAFGLIWIAAGMAHAAYDAPNVWINGVRVDWDTLQMIEGLNCTSIPDGRYWLNPNTGVWGYADGPAQGRLGDGCRGRRGAPYYQSGAFGTTGSDGETSYYYDSESGCSVIPGEGVSC